ncbi:hypothetical protein M5361_13760 [Ligilactobacillus agilis]|nr:hypothetical protein [Ligilactobacillus agilis]
MAFGDLMQNTTKSTHHRVPSQPAGIETWTVKHDARDGSMSIILNDNDRNDPDSKPTIVDIDSASFIPAYGVSNVSGSIDDSSVFSNPSLAGIYDVYLRIDKNNTESLGIKTHNDIKNEQQFKVGQRLFGFLTAINGANVSNLDDEKYGKLKELFPESGIKMVWFQFTPTKYYSMTNQLNIPYEEANTAVKDHILTIESVDKKSKEAGKFKKNSKNGSNFLPKFTLKAVKPNTLARLTSKAEDETTHLAEYHKAIKERDAFLIELRQNQITGPDVVNNLDENGIYNVETLKEFVGEGTSEDWQRLQKLANGGLAPVTNQAERDKQIMSALGGETQPTVDTAGTSDFDEDDDLPF